MVNGSDASCEDATGGALSYGTERPAMASLIQMLQDSEAAPGTSGPVSPQSHTAHGIPHRPVPEAATPVDFSRVFEP